MSFALMRVGFPNMAAVALLAALPLLSLAMNAASPRPAPAAQVIAAIPAE
jgi:hypothetical protein